MTKVKRNTQNKATTTTPLKTVNGKVRKVRSRIKNLKSQTKHSDNESLIKSRDSEDLSNLHQFVSPKLRTCYVKLRRAHIKDSIGSQNSDNTLQVQCKLNKSLTKSIGTEDLTNLDKFVSPKLRTCYVKLRRAHIKDSIGSRSNTLHAQCKLNKLADTNLNVGVNTKTEDKLKESTSISGNNILHQKKCRAGKSTIDLHVTPTKRPTRRCAVRINQSLQNITNYNKILAPSNPTCTNSLVRLKRTPQKCIDELVHVTIDTLDLTHNESQTVIPELDETKRNNFRKLSLNKSKNEKAKSKRGITEYENISEITSEKQSQTTTHNIEKYTESQTSKLTQNCSEMETLAKTNLTKKNNDHLNKFKHLQKLSLKRNKPVENTNSTNLEINQFEPQQNSTICFAPVRNSTLIELNFTTDKNKQTNIIEVNNNEREKRNSNNISSSHNLANKSHEIEKLIDSLDDDNADEDTEHNGIKKKDIVQDNQKLNLPISYKTSKFFHRQDKNLVKVDENVAQTKSPSKRKSSVLKRRRFLTNSSSLAKRNNIYEFLSQSQTSDSDSNKHLDPAADIIKRLIAQGKVRVATTCKGKGRPMLKRNARIKPPTKKVKPTAVKKGKKNQKEPIVRNADNKTNSEVNDHIDFDDHFMDDYDHDEPFPEVNNNMEEQHQDEGVKRFDNNHQHHVCDQEGTFSRLARSVLLNQTGRSDLQRQKAQRLLEMAKKYVSTPKNKKMLLPQVALYSNLSPISMPSPRPAGNASPWRVDEDAHLPRVFNFNRSSGNLPSFSSDFIPSTPRKGKAKNKSILTQHSTLNSQPQSHVPAIDNQSSIPSLPSHDLFPYPTTENYIAGPTPQATNEQSILSSFSSNDSNAENMPPPKSGHVTRKDNDNIFDLKQYPNPKKSLNYRSPLKAINILEVVHLPTFKPSSKTLHAKDNEEMFGFEEDLHDDSIEIERSSNGLTPQKTHCIKSKKSHIEDLFGFEDFLTQTDLSSQELCDDMETTNHKNKSMHDKLQDLRKLRPDEHDLQYILLKEKSSNPLKTKALFDDGASGGVVDVDGMRQQGIKEMLCSTMIQSPQASTSKAALEQLKKRNLRYIQKPNFVEDSNLSELFKDPEPEVTYNENDARRTYVRPYKRKRRLKENKFVMYLESDESGDEDSAEHNKQQHSHEFDTSLEKAQKKKRVRKVAKENPEMTEFIHDFNEMCKEVDNYQLIVEKSA